MADIEIRVVDIETDEVVKVIPTTEGKFDRVLSGMLRQLDTDRYFLDYDDPIEEEGS